MPITPAHQWQESANWVSIDVKIPNVTTSSADILTTECYVKVNCTPFFFEADLFNEVDNQKSKASVGQNTVNFFLVKKEEGLWERLTMPGDKQMRLNRRQKSLEAIREEREKVRKEYPAKFSNIGRLAVGEQLKMEEMKRKLIEERKEAEQLMEQQNIEFWKSSLMKESTDNKQIDSKHSAKIWDTSEDEYVVGMANPNESKIPSQKPNGGIQFVRDKDTDRTLSPLVGNSIAKDLGTFENIKGSKKEAEKLHEFQGDDEPKIKEVEDQKPIVEEDVDLQPTTLPIPSSNCKASVGSDGGLRYAGLTLPAPRSCSAVSVTFTPKPDLPQHLPARESREKEIKLRKSGKASEDALDVSERAPLFLQDKGDKFFKTGDYQSAVNAYTDALTKDPSLVISFANRGACKLHLKEYQACIQDCTSALCIVTKGTPDCAQESILAQSLLIPVEDCGSSSSTSDATQPQGEVLVNESPKLTFDVDSLGLVTCLSGEGCCSSQGLTIEGAGVEEWKIRMKKHMLIRRGVARYYSGDLLKARDDFGRAVQIKPVNGEVERILEELINALGCDQTIEK